MRGEEVVAALKESISDDTLIVSSNGNVSRQVFNFLPQPQVYLRGSMGLPMSIGLGLALAQPDKQVLVITGDGNFLMGLSSMATIGNNLPSNFRIIILDNGSYATTGGQETVTSSLDYLKLLEGLGIQHYGSLNAIESPSMLSKAFEILLTSEQTSVLHIVVGDDVENLENIPWKPIEIKENFLNKFD
ncbi:MAG: thiamine pyrophosphate-dependent enzyme [Candidatus Heimdallarchaeaceae archaeon]